MAQEPITMIVAPFDVYVAPVGETFPDVDDTPAGNWVKLGTSGNKDMDESGLTVQHNQTVDLHRVYGATGPRKATRSSEDHIFTFTLVDLSPTEYARILNHNTVSSTAAGTATGGYDDVNLYQGMDVTQKAWLFKGENASPLLSTGHVQYELPRGVVTSSPTVAYTKGAPAGLTIEVTAIFDTDESSGEEMGRLYVQDAEPTG